MQELPVSLQQLIESFMLLPGVGQRTAQRYALGLLRLGFGAQNLLANHIQALSQIKNCEQCFSYCDNSQVLCPICLDENRDTSVICVVENFQDLLAIEKSGRYRGMFHVLGGVLNPLLGIGPSQLQIQLLQTRLMDSHAKRIILALNPSLEGDATSSYLLEVLPATVRIERLGLGIPVGGSLEFLDAMTISSAFENSKTMTKYS